MTFWNENKGIYPLRAFVKSHFGLDSMCVSLLSSLTVFLKVPLKTGLLSSCLL